MTGVFKQRRISRRTLLGSAAALAAELTYGQTAAPAAPPAAPSAERPWWHHFPSFEQSDNPEVFAATHVRMVIHGLAKDPTWGPFAQRVSVYESGESFKKVKAMGARCITWIEGFGDCMLYAVQLNQKPDGTFVTRPEDPAMPLVARSHWNWTDANRGQGTPVFRWVGIHNYVNNEDFCRAILAAQEANNYSPMPEYPDGRRAIGVMVGKKYPLNQRVYDACGSKDVNGELAASYETPAKVNDKRADGTPAGPTEGLFPAQAGWPEVQVPAGVGKGETVYCGVISVHKDISAPFWGQYVRRSIKEIVKRGLDGVWCDNYSPWDNFGYPPVEKAFGEWSAAGFNGYLKQHATAAKRAGLPVGSEADAFNVREEMKKRAAAYGAADPTNLHDAAWHSPKWLSDGLWSAYKAYRQSLSQQRLKEFYAAIHAEALAAGRPDFCIGGNDVPMYGLGWVQDGWQDMINTETTPGWHMGSGSRGITIPPQGKMAIMYRAALEHQKGPFSAAWYYLNGPYAKYQKKPGLGRLLCAEAFANGAFLMCMPDNADVCGTVESHGWWNQFVRDNEAAFGARTPWADAAVLFSPDNQLQHMTPGGYTDIDDQPHIFGHHGWATALIDAHIPYRALTDWKLTTAELTGIKTLVLPHALSLSDVAMDTIVGWVKAGGRVIVSGAVGSLQAPSGWFARRAEGQDLAGRLGLIVGKTVRVGKGEALLVPGNPGQEYYLKSEQRAALLESIKSWFGTRLLVDAETVPSTVGIFAWKAADGIYLDLVNYNIDLETDTPIPAQGLHFSVRLPAGLAVHADLQASTLSPDLTRPAKAIIQDGTAEITLDRLTTYASVRIKKG
jgi:hypothetical protein